jgi:2-oxoglutarate ferredoxin oxidoreductase subunit gamma
MKPSDRIKIRIAGSGGQGVVLASIILAEAAAIHEGYEVCQCQSYGPEARGGFCKAEIVISNEPIDYPRAINLDVLLCLNQSSLDAYQYDLKEEGILIVNADQCPNVLRAKAFSIPFATLARDKVGIPQTMNIIALGAFAAITEIVSPAALKKAVLARAPKGTEKANTKAVEIGVREAQKAKENMKHRLPKKFSHLILMNE